MLSLVRVSRRAQSIGFPTLNFTPLKRYLLSRYFFSIGLPLYLALDAHHHHFALHYQAGLLPPASLDTQPHQATGLKPSQARLSCRFARPVKKTTRSPPGLQLPFGLIPVHSPLLQKSLLVSSPPFNDMLKSKGSSAATQLIRISQNTNSRISPSFASFLVRETK